MFRLALLALVGALAFGCTHIDDRSRSEERPKLWLDPATPPVPTDMRYLIAPATGTLHMEVRPEILASVRTSS